MGIADTLDTIVQYGTGPITVYVDYRVTHSLTMCRYYYQLRMLRSDAL